MIRAPSGPNVAGDAKRLSENMNQVSRARSFPKISKVSAELTFSESGDSWRRAEIEVSSSPVKYVLAPNTHQVSTSADLVFADKRSDLALQTSEAPEGCGVDKASINPASVRDKFRQLIAVSGGRANTPPVRKARSLPTSTSAPDPLGVRSKTSTPFYRKSASLGDDKRVSWGDTTTSYYSNSDKTQESEEVREIEVLKRRGLEETKKRIQELATLDWEIKFCNGSDNEVYSLPISSALSPRGDDLHTQAIESAVLAESSRDTSLLSKPQNQAKEQVPHEKLLPFTSEKMFETATPKMFEPTTQDNSGISAEVGSLYGSSKSNATEASVALNEGISSPRQNDELLINIQNENQSNPIEPKNLSHQSDSNYESNRTVASAALTVETSSPRQNDELPTSPDDKSIIFFQDRYMRSLERLNDALNLGDVLPEQISPPSSPRELRVVDEEGLASPASSAYSPPSSPRGQMPASTAGSRPNFPPTSPREMEVVLNEGLTSPASPADSEPTSPPTSPREEMPASHEYTNLSSKERIEEFMQRLKEEKDRLAHKPYDLDYNVFREEMIKGQGLESEKSQALAKTPSIPDRLYHLKLMPNYFDGIIYDNHEVLPIKHSDLVGLLNGSFRDNMVYEVRVGKLSHDSFQFYFYESQTHKAENFGSPIFLINDNGGEIFLDKGGNDITKRRRTIIEKASGFYDPDKSRYEFTPIPIRDNLSRTALYPELNFLMFLQSKMDKFSHNGNYSVAIQEKNGVFDLFPMRYDYDDKSNSNSKILRIPTTTGVKEIDLNNLPNHILEAHNRQIERQIAIDNAHLMRVANRGEPLVSTLGARVRVVSKEILGAGPNSREP